MEVASFNAIDMVSASTYRKLTSYFSAMGLTFEESAFILMVSKYEVLV